MAIPYYTDINEFLASISLPVRTSNPIFFCHRLQQGVTTYRAPFKRSFYFFALFNNYGKVQVNYDDKTLNDPESYMVCHSPNLIYSFSHGNTLEGYILYFKPECFSFFKPDFHKTFPFFNVLFTNLYNIDRATSHKLAPHFEEVVQTYERTSTDQHIEARVKLLSLLYHIKEFTAGFNDGAARFLSPQQLLLSKFIHSVNSHYIDKRTVNEYAELLAVTPNHLSQTIKEVSGKNALSYINERLLIEARSLIQHTTYDITEIAYQLGFSDPANFGKFIKKHVGMAPSELRRSAIA